MKKPLLLFIFSGFFIFNGEGQNLVSNGSFEQYTSCPTGMYQFDSLLFWFNPTNASPDYYNQCAPLNSGASVPYNFSGYQQANNGDAYCGIELFSWNSAGDYHEYLEIQLESTLIVNLCYYFEMFINLSNLYGRYTTDDVGVYFSDTIITGIPNTFTLTLPAQINNATGNYPDSANWILVSGNYTATGTENYIIIGNFKTNANTDTILYNNTVPFHDSYVYIDDVSLTPCTGIEEQTQNEAIKIYPNPVKDELFVNCYSFTGKKEIIISDILGKEIYRDQFSKTNFQFPISNFESGIYFVEINDGKNILRKKFLKVD